MKWQIDIATSNLELLSDDEIITGFQQYITSLREGIKCYHELEDYLREQQCPDHSIALAIRTRYLFEAEIKWVKDYIKSLGLQLPDSEEDIK